ncbi:endonuclease III domain-containing protein [Ammoniphilus resinae]|uniref:Endonuclease-3 related protein n=1 Tax=Ammoniphilus resinae TaxID=861532 RepID=A0ABS4GJW6_9BACL|nr:endonuclease III domain-containing protein [Ammoniphilus resinae]MBP1930554.1 endonuclease-3 related protein [Ammoniphilus resinae]
MKKDYQFIYNILFNHYGPQNWWPAESPFEMMIGAILVQNTNWNNVEKALNNLSEFMHPEEIDQLPIEKLAGLIRPSGFYKLKAKRIKSFLTWFKTYNYDIALVKKVDKHLLRLELLDIHGIGRETADVILLYALDTPIFVVDAYARRIFYRLGFDLPNAYDSFRKQIEKELPEDLTLYNEYHALLVQHAKDHCKANPLCDRCPILDVCERRVSRSV